MHDIVQFQDKETKGYIKIDRTKKIVLGHKEVLPNTPWLGLQVVDYDERYKSYVGLDDIVGWLNRQP